jgi:hypothetical protein
MVEIFSEGQPSWFFACTQNTCSALVRGQPSIIPVIIDNPSVIAIPTLTSATNKSRYRSVMSRSVANAMHSPL